jgi:hypothetical protein
MSVSIKYLKRKEIDVEKWDECITRASAGLIYANSYYLDAVCTNWDAIIINDYETVMPLPWRKKYGIRYIYQSAFIQRLGIFGNPDHYDLDIIYKEAFKHFSFVHYNVSANNAFANFQVKKNQNFFIDLNKSYREIRLAYSKECLLNIKKAEARGCYFTDEISEIEVINNYQTAYGFKNKNIKERDYIQFLNLLQKAKQKNAVQLLGVKDGNGVTIYSAAIFKDTKRIYYILGAPTKEGREKRATYFFIDYVLKLNAGSLLQFDFEGSDIPNVAAFYKKFGPMTEWYYEVKLIPLLSNIIIRNRN